MLNYIVYILNIVLLFLSGLFQNDISFEYNTPDEVEAGKSFVVQITINKQNVESFARLQQDFPAGYYVVPRDLANGDFTFKDQKMKIIWLKIPSDSTFTISYTVEVDPTVEGSLELGGAFSYITNNERKTIELPTKKITVYPPGKLPSDNIVNNTDTTNTQDVVYTNTDTSNATEDPTSTYCWRQIIKEGDDYIVSYLINKGNIANDKFAKIQEKIPSEFTATLIETKESIFSFKDNTVKFLWMSLPADDKFIVKFRLTGNGDINQLNGNFSYILDESTKIISIKNADFLDKDALALNTNNTNNDSNNNTDTNNTDTNNTNNTDTNNTNNTDTNNNQNTDNNNNNLTDNTNNTDNNNVNNQLKSDNGIYYKVQIAAGKQRAVNPRYYFRQFNVTEKVQIEMHDGWNKYTVGKFNEYQAARNHREKIWNSTPIRDAFVSAYNSGSRITVQEALMIANQKWVQ